jgi:hypothetical protein
MARTYNKMLPIWYMKEKVKLTDRYSSGLEWVEQKYYHKIGDMAGRWTKPGDYYVVRMNDLRFHAHRLVYYLRTEIDPGNADVLHLPDNKTKDNRQELILRVRGDKELV